jgi:hypothetical protein
MEKLEEQGHDTSQVIAIPAEGGLHEALEVKLDEYRSRLIPYGIDFAHPSKVLFESFVLGGNTGALSAMLKQDLLHRVLVEGSISFKAFHSLVMDDDIYKQSAKARPIVFNDCLLNACQVISAYCDGRTNDLSGGTGLPSAQ